MQGTKKYYYKAAYKDTRPGRVREAGQDFTEDFYTASIAVGIYYQQTSAANSKKHNTYEAKELDVMYGRQQMLIKGSGKLPETMTTTSAQMGKK